MHTKNVLTFGFATTLLALSNADSLGDFDSSGEGDKHVTPKQWKLALAAPNATTSIDVIGPGTSISPVVGDSQATWKLSVNVTADVPSDKDDSEYWTGTAISLTPPDSFIKKVKNGTEEVRPKTDWQLCSVFFTEVPANATKDDGTCKQVLGDDCIKDIEDRRIWSPRDCSSFEFPKSCSLHGKVGLINKVNGSNWLHEPLFGIVSNEPHKKGDTSDYERVVTTYMPIILGWSADLHGEEGGLLPRTTVSCVRADDFTEGSQRFTPKDVDDDKDSGALVMKPSFTTIGMIAVAGIAMFL